MTRRLLTDKEVENLFLDLWWKLAPETYETLHVEGIAGDLLISDCAEVFPKLYRNLLKMLEEEAYKKGYALP